MGLITRWLGVEDVLTHLKAEREDTRVMMREILEIAHAQIAVTAHISDVLARLSDAYQVVGPPEGRPHYSDEIEAIAWEQTHES